MISPNRHRLLEDALLPAALTESLTATRRAARLRRARRRTVRAAVGVCLVFAGAWFFGYKSKTTTHQQAPIAVSQKRPPFVLVTNGSRQSSVAIRTVAAPANFVVTTRAAPVSISTATHDELFASAGSRPGGLVHLADGTSRWMWLDVPELQ